MNKKMTCNDFFYKKRHKKRGFRPLLQKFYLIFIKILHNFNDND